MAAQTRLIRLDWENGVNFKMSSKLGEGSYITIVDVDENGHLSSLWNAIQKVCELYIKKELDIIGEEMKAE